jgi:uncharacterized membrane protein YsdA (DUF1294 family)
MSLSIFLAFNVVTFLLIGFDKCLYLMNLKAERLSRSVFYVLSFLGGAVGISYGMKVFRHFTRDRYIKKINLFGFFTGVILILYS